VTKARLPSSWTGWQTLAGMLKMLGLQSTSCGSDTCGADDLLQLEHAHGMKRDSAISACQENVGYVCLCIMDTALVRVAFATLMLYTHNNPV
jgi:hypothetical protein